MAAFNAKWIPLIAGLLHAATAAAADRYIIFGGGPVLGDAQVSIESNVLWIDEVLQQRYRFAGSTLLFGAGREGVPDVMLRAPASEQTAYWHPLARLFGEQAAPMQYRANRVARSSGASSRQNVAQLLDSEVKSLASGDSLLLIYSGHGSHEPADTTRNALRLWGESRLDVNEFARLLNAAPAGTNVRYVLPQCFSGAFSRSIFQQPGSPAPSGIAGNRCGFFAVSEHIIAEGCTAGIDVGDYRDYSTYFVAALAGQTRTGAALEANPDRDGDQKISLAEAHAYAYTYGFSTDVPRSTSDFYLEQWEPWFVRWHSFVPLQDGNPYWQMAQTLASRLQLAPLQTHALGAQALAKRRELGARIEALEQQQRERRGAAERQRKTLLERFLQHWPDARHPHSAAYIQFVQRDAAAALQWIAQQPDYPELAAQQDAVEAATLELLELRRKEAQYARLTRALRLAALRENFDRLASGAQRQQYRALTACEAWIPPR